VFCVCHARDALTDIRTPPGGIKRPVSVGLLAARKVLQQAPTNTFYTA